MQKPKDTKDTFESLVANIDVLVAKLEDPQTDIEQSIQYYEAAMKLITKAQQRLTNIQHTFERISTQGSRVHTDNEQDPDSS